MATELVNVEINGIKVQAEKGWNILQAAKCSHDSHVKLCRNRRCLALACDLIPARLCVEILTVILHLLTHSRR